jgi:DNA (cytosine-5)-methyltransferase 1
VTVGSLFAGIGGFDLGFERAGFEIKWQVEIDPFCRAVLAKHWPDVRRYEDVRTVGGELERVDVLCGGFPCQDISSAGGKAGISGEQSGLWAEMFRIVCELRPCYVVVENVADLLARGLGRILGDLASVGYDAEWDCIQAAAVGAPHGRDRLWLIAYPHANEGRCEVSGERDSATLQTSADRDSCWRDTDRFRADVPDAAEPAEAAWARRWSRAGVDFARWRVDARQRAGWKTEPAICRMADGVSPGLDNARLAALGNAIVPQIAEWIARRILHAEEAVNQ